MVLRSCLLLSLAACAAPDDGLLPAGYGAWELVWSEEFDGAAGEPVDERRWRHEVGGDGWGNEQLEYDTDSTDNVRLDGEGNLEIVAREEDFGGRSYTSGRISTIDRFELDRGRVEARIQVPEGRGLWPAFWMLGADYEEVGWPSCGEIDVMELRGEEPATSLGTVHGPGYSGGEGIGGEYSLSEGSFADDFHVFAVDIDPEHIAWSVDDEVFLRLHPGDLPAGSSWAFDRDFFLLLNLAVGGTFLDEPDDSTPFPATLRVDHVRAYTRAEG
jgi:beta-glucanase (GH16 family)